MKRQYARIIEVAEAYEITVTIEVHGHFTTQPEFLERMPAFYDSPFLRLNLDTGNSLTAGHDPVAFCTRFREKIATVHLKDVSISTAARTRRRDSRVDLPPCTVGDGLNRENIRQVLALLHMGGYTGHLSLECESQGRDRCWHAH